MGKPDDDDDEWTPEMVKTLFAIAGMAGAITNLLTDEEWGELAGGGRNRNRRMDILHHKGRAAWREAVFADVAEILNRRQRC